MAVEMAKNKADAMAEAAGMTVVKAVNISEDGYYPQARYNTAGASDDGGCCCRYGRYAGRSVHRSPGKRNF